MAVGEYLKVAAGQLRRAADALKLEMNELERQIRTTEVDKGADLSTFERDEARHKAAAMATNSSDEERQKRREAEDAHRARVATENEIQKIKAEISDRIRQMQQNSQVLLEEAKELERRAPQM